MRGSGYKISVKSAAFQFLFYPMVEIDASCIVNDAGRSKENHRETTGKKSKKVMKKKKKIQRIGKKTKKSSTRKHRVKKCNVSDIFS